MENLGFVRGSLKVENQSGEWVTDVSERTTNQRQRMLKTGDFLHIQKVENANTITIDYALRSDITQLQPIEFDMIFAQNEFSPINRTDCQNYAPRIINPTDLNDPIKNVQKDQLEDFSICLEYEVERLDFTKSKVINIYHYFKK